MVRLKLLLGYYRFNAQAGVIAQAVILLVVKAEVIAGILVVRALRRQSRPDCAG